MMTPTEYAKWRKNGNFTISQLRMLEVSNHIAEGETLCYTKAEAAQCAQYWSLCHSNLQNQLSLKEFDEMRKKVNETIKRLP